MPGTVDPAVAAEVLARARPLTDDEVRERRESGLTNRYEHTESRSVASILAANILTRFNAIITVLLVVILVFGEPADAMFGLVMIINALIGIIQELRAKRTLDRLTLLAAPRATVVRADGSHDIATDDIVLDDIVDLRRGQSLPVDGIVVQSDGLEVSEALLTGESLPIPKERGARVLSGSFVIAGSGSCVATGIGADSYANRLAAEAKKFTLARSDLAEAIDQILRIVTWLLVPTSALLLYSQLQTGRSVADGLVGTVAGVVAMVPQGLVLLVSMAFAVAVIRLGERNVLVQELPAVETLARVDIVCVDKTGTLTDGTIRLAEVHRFAEGGPDPGVVLGSLVAADADPNPTMQAIGSRYPAYATSTVVESLAFSSDRKLSAVAFADGAAWVIGAPEFVFAHSTDAMLGVGPAIMDAASQGRRVVVVGATDAAAVASRTFEDVTPVFVLEFEEQIRPDAADTVRYFTDQHVALKVISGDAPTTVAAVAAATGIPGTGSIEGGALPEDLEARADIAEATAVFGRVTPEQKRDLVRAFQARGHIVAMTGDGVNDVLAVKEADLGIAMGSGSGAAKAVSQLVLLDDRFASLPHVVAEGRRVVANMERVASLFLTKTVYATFLAVAIGFVGLAFPFLPRHLTLIGSLTIGIPAFFLSFEPREIPIREGFLPRALAFAIPAGLVSGIATFTLYGVSRIDTFDLALEQSRTAATTMMIVLGLIVLYEVIEPKEPHHYLMLASLFAGYLFVLAVPPLRTLFDLTVPRWQAWLVIAAVSVLAGFIMKALIGWTQTWVGRRYGIDVA